MRAAVERQRAETVDDVIADLLVAKCVVKRALQVRAQIGVLVVELRHQVRVDAVRRGRPDNTSGYSETMMSFYKRND